MKDYREPEGLSDSVLLERLLEHEEQLTEAELHAFTDMLFALPHSRRKLSSKQREWAEGVYKRNDLQAHYVANIASATKVRSAAPHPFDRVIANRPLKPPGR